MKNNCSTLYTSESANLELLQETIIAVIGYGNQGRAQALNLRDSGAHVIIGNLQDRYSDLARIDGFQVHEISSAVAQAEIILLLIPDEVLPGVFETTIKPYLKPNSTLVFASGYNVAFNHITLPANVDAVLLAPRMLACENVISTKKDFIVLWVSSKMSAALLNNDCLRLQWVSAG